MAPTLAGVRWRSRWSGWALLTSLVVAAGLLVTTSGSVRAAVGEITTIAGDLGDGPATDVGQTPTGLALHGTSLYVSDGFADLIRVVDLTTGQQRVVTAGGSPARMSRPEGIDVDAAGNLYVAAFFDDVVLKIDPLGRISTVAGNAASFDGFGGDGGPATAASLNGPRDVALDGGGNLYIADTRNHRVRRVSASGTISTVAGSGAPGYGGDLGAATSAQLHDPTGVAADGAGNLYIADSSNNRVRKVDAQGVITTIGGTGSGIAGGDGGPASAAGVNRPNRVDLDHHGNLYVSQGDPVGVRRIDPAGTITTLAAGKGLLEGGTAATPNGTAVDGAGNVYVALSGPDGSRVQRITAGGTVSTVAGNGYVSFGGDGGPGLDAQIGLSPQLALGPGGHVFVAESDNERVRRIDDTGRITTVARFDFFTSPKDIAFDDRAGNLYVAAFGRIIRIDAQGRSTAVVGDGNPGLSGDGGPAVDAKVSQPSALELDEAGNLYIADWSHNRVRRVDHRNGVITTVAGGGSSDLGDGGPATAASLHLQPESGLAVDAAGNLFISDTRNRRIRKVDAATGIITTVAGPGEYAQGDGGPATQASIGSPAALALDGAGNLFFTSFSCRVRQVDTAGIITTVAGGECNDRSNAHIGVQGDLVVDAAGNLLVGDSRHIRKVEGVAVPVPANPSSSPPTPPPPVVFARAWGLNHVGELGDGSTAGSTGPRGAGLLSGTEQVAAGYYHSTALAPDGTVSTWGWNALGQLGDGTTVDRHAPVTVPGLSGVSAVASGATHTLALREDGTVWAWGWNAVGQLGTGTTADRRTPAQVRGLSGIVAVAAGGYHSLALAADGSVWAWGWNAQGQLGNGGTIDSRSPVKVTGLTGVTALAGGGSHSLALLADGTVRSWGWNAYGQLGTGTTTDARRPVAVAGLGGATSITAGALHSLAARSDGTVRAWGWNGVGQLGDGSNVDRRAPVVSGPLAGVTKVAAGAYHSLALEAGGAIVGWGWNAYGQLGDGTTLNRSRPLARPVAQGARSVSGGAGHTVAAAP